MSKIKVKCTDQVLTWVNKPEISQGDQNLDSVVFECDETWNGYVKVGVFFKQKGALSYSMVDGTGTCSIPNSVMRENGKIYFGVTGTNRNNQVKTSNLLAYTIKDGVANASLNDEFPGDLTDEEKDDVYHKMLELAQKFSEKLAFVQVKGVNEFEYNEAKFTEKVQKCIREINEEFETNMENDVNQFKENIREELNDRDHNMMLKSASKCMEYTATVKQDCEDGIITLSNVKDGLEQKKNGDIILDTDTTKRIDEGLKEVESLKGVCDSRLDDCNRYDQHVEEYLDENNVGYLFAEAGEVWLFYHNAMVHSKFSKMANNLREKYKDLLQ